MWEINDSGVLEAVEYTDLVDMTVYSFVTSTVASGRYVIINRDRKGKWWITAEDC